MRMRESQKTPRIGLTGCGTIGRLHAGHLAKRGTDLVFHNRTREKAEDFGNRFHGKVSGEFEALVAGCDAIVIATPPEQHTEQVLTALAAGKPVMVEKPLCVSPDELTRIEAAAAAAPRGAFVLVAENYYYKPSLALMRETILWDGIGPVQSMQVKKLTQQQAVNWKAACGALLEGGIHFVALAADLADTSLARVDPAVAAALADSGEEPRTLPPPIRVPTSVSAEFPTASPGGPAERQSRLTLAYEGGLEVNLHYAWDVPSMTKGTFQHSRIEGEAGRILFESNGIYVDIRGPGRKGLSFPGFGDLMGYEAMTDEFLACIGKGRTPYSNLARARRDLDIVFRAYEHLP
ncbi:MAG TPA: Gfo/Idh/MocA family oxidoreductase [Candidatus Latescibacteria bacterium]|jgi:predicted dehydrogenase|nr:Gfo/Idh/MocA family oxidoreductase [Candidatus Latescibacterota bacterium]HJP33894.1 Gfo/Idh/MocA family oxidoreductase [Candidatus Latescibacterota bacterium]